MVNERTIERIAEALECLVDLKRTEDTRSEAHVARVLKVYDAQDAERANNVADRAKYEARRAEDLKHRAEREKVEDEAAATTKALLESVEKWGPAGIQRWVKHEREAAARTAESFIGTAGVTLDKVAAAIRERGE